MHIQTIEVTHDREGYLFAATWHRKPVDKMVLVGGAPKVSGKIVALMRQTPAIAIPKLAEIIGVTKRSVERNIQKLQDHKVIRPFNPAKGGHWEVME